MKIDSIHYTVFDVETTGLYPYSGDRICEIGAVKFSAGSRSLKRFHSLVDPERPVSAGAFTVNGITDEMLRGKPKIGEVMPGFLNFIEGSVLVAYNAGFDLGFIEASLGENKDLLDKYVIIDALALARRLFSGIKRYNLASVAQHIGASTEGEHRALADAIITMKVFKAQLELLRSEGVKTVEEICRVSAKRAAPRPLVKDYTLELIESAIRQQKKLNIVYRSSWNGTVSSRTITPKSVHRGYDRAYVVAHCHMRGEERNFRLDCILKAEHEH